MPESAIFADLRRPRRVWAVGAIHGEARRLAALHDEIGRRFLPGDRLVYLGNVIGRAPGAVEAMDELLSFRRALIALPGALAGDVVYLRGSQEEMLQKLLQLQFAPNPAEVLGWMLRQGLDATLADYGAGAEEGMRAARAGAVALARWTGEVRARLRAHPGHENLLACLRRAAFASEPDPAAGDGRRPAGLLLVSAGLDPSRPLAAQGDAFWWAGAAFSRIERPYETFRRVVRGFDPAGGGVRIGEAAATIDGGAGLGGTLACACLAPEGEVLELHEC